MTRYVSLGSICAAIAIPLFILVESFAFGRNVPDSYLLFTSLLALVVVFTHRKNIQRLIAGTENRFSFSSGKDKPGTHV